MFVCLSIILSVCHQDYCKSNQPMSLNLYVMIWPVTWKNNDLINF